MIMANTSWFNPVPTENVTEVATVWTNMSDFTEDVTAPLANLPSLSCGDGWTAIMKGVRSVGYFLNPFILVVGLVGNAITIIVLR
jgi:hypothetical protein